MMQSNMDSYQIVSKKKRKKKHTQTNTPKHSKLLVNNLFAPLQTNDETDDTQSMASEVSKVHKHTAAVYKPPPIIITSPCNVNDVMKELEIVDYTYKTMSIGHKLIINSANEQEKCKKYLTLKKIEFYTHRPRGNKLLKAVLYGLPQTEVNQLKIYFNKNLNAKPLEIFEMNTKNKNIHNTLYLFHFDRNEVSMSDLRKIKVINHSIVNWMPYSPKFKGPTQCRNCSMYGHGSENCHRGSVCLLCASNGHSVKDCKLAASNIISNSTNSTANIIYKCYNCHSKKLQSNHRANDPKCPFRVEYVKLRNSINERNIQRPQQPRMNRIFTSETHHFPPLNPHSTAQNTFETHTNTYAHQLKSPATDDLFSISQLLQIFNGAVTKLKQCTTKIEQINVIASLLEYAIQ